MVKQYLFIQYTLGERRTTQSRLFRTIAQKEGLSKSNHFNIEYCCKFASCCNREFTTNYLCSVFTLYAHNMDNIFI